MKMVPTNIKNFTFNLCKNIFDFNLCFIPIFSFDPYYFAFIIAKFIDIEIVP